ncbi:uncharacterized protein ACRADG_012303 isoform 1-T5 [Cochliomyia hominivorax]
MSVVTNVAGSTLRQQHHAKAQQNGNKSPQSNNTNTKHALASSPQTSMANCLQQLSPPPSSSKTSLSTSPIASNYMGSSSLFSFESGVVLSGSSGCCSLSNSPSSSSSSNSYSHSIENKLSMSSGNQMCLNASTNLEDSFASATCPLNSSLLAAVNGELEEDNVMQKSTGSIQTESKQHTSESITNSNNDTNENNQRLLLENIHHHQQTPQLPSSDSSCLNNEDARTLQLAVELTMMNLNQMPLPTSGASSSLLATSNHYPQLQSHLQSGSIENSHQPFTSSSYTSIGNPYHMTTKVFLQTQSQTAATLLNQKMMSEGNQDTSIPAKINSLSNNQNMSTITPTVDERSKKSQNMTECVPVPSSEHVAEIVGRQGCKIKALRAKTNTYIKTPVRNEEPVFVVTGRKEDVAKAKREILSAAEHFTLIRATRRTNDGISGCSSAIAGGGYGGSIGNHLASLNKNSLSSTTPLPGQITIQVRVPYRVVGLVVGPKGNTIKHIQHETQTYIVTPSRDKEPIFEVTGMPDNVQMARKQIEAHIATRTGSSLAVPAPPPPPPPPPAPAGAINRLSETMNSNQNSAFHSLNSLNKILNDDLHSEILSSIYKNGIGSALEYSQIGGSLLNSTNKCNTSNSFNGFVNNEMNSNVISVNDIQRRVATNSGHNNGNMQLNCNEFINNIMDTNGASQFTNEQQTNFSHITNNSNAFKNLNTVISTINLLENANNLSNADLLQHHQLGNLNTNALLTRSCSSASSTASSSKSFNNNGNNSNHFWKSLNVGTSLGAATNGASNNENIDIDEGIGESPLYSWCLPNTIAALTSSYCSPTSISPTDSLFAEQNNKAILQQQQQQLKLASKTKLLEKFKRKNCWMCHEKDIVAALVPCGHTIFCSLCANRLCQQNDAVCPVCSVQIYQAIKIH